MKKLLSWLRGNAQSVFVGCIVTLVMLAIMFFKDMKSMSREAKMLNDIEELLVINQKNAEEHKAAGEYIDFQQLVISNYRNRTELQDIHLEQHRDMLNRQALMLKSLIDYLKQIKEWPPKIDPPKPINPDTLANKRNSV